MQDTLPDSHECSPFCLCSSQPQYQSFVRVNLSIVYETQPLTLVSLGDIIDDDATIGPLCFDFDPLVPLALLTHPVWTISILLDGTKLGPIRTEPQTNEPSSISLTRERYCISFLHNTSIRRIGSGFSFTIQHPRQTKKNPNQNGHERSSSHLKPDC